MLTMAIQAGGASRRMGRDKGLTLLLGKPLVRRVIERTEHLADEILVTTNQPEAYAFLGIRLVPDILPGRGALGGLYTALKAAAQPIVAVIACDMPFVNPSLLAAEVQLLNESNVDLVIPQTEEGFEPFHAVYRRATCLSAVEAALRSDKWRADSWYDQINLKPFSLEEIKVFDPQGLSFWNINTPEDLQRAELLAQQHLSV